MPCPCFLVSDIHGRPGRYRALWRVAIEEKPAAIFLAGDLLPGGLALGASRDEVEGDFIEDFLASGFRNLRATLADRAPRVLLVLGNDDPAVAVPAFERIQAGGAWEHLHGRMTELGGRSVYGYACVPPSPFLLKDWERYDVSRYVSVGSVSPEEGWRSVSMPSHELRWRTIARELDELTAERDLQDAVLLFHAPPYNSALDRAALDGQMIDHAPIDPHVGSIAIQRLIEQRQPWLTLHGHVHESSRLTGSWKEQHGRTVMLSAAHEDSGLCLVRFDLHDPAAATREIVPIEREQRILDPS